MGSLFRKEKRIAKGGYMMTPDEVMILERRILLKKQLIELLQKELEAMEKTLLEGTDD